MKTLILCGGLGTRLNSVSNGIPKCMMKINDRFFIYYLLDLLISKGLDDVILCTGHGHKIIKNLIGNRYNGAKISYSKENKALGTGGAILHSLSSFSDRRFFVLNGDSYCDFDLEIEQILNDSLNFIYIHKVQNISRYGEVKINKIDNSVTSFIEKRAHEESGYINAGIYVLNRSIFEPFVKNVFLSLESEILPSLVGKLKGIMCNKGFIDIGTPSSLIKSHIFFADQFTLEKS